MLFPMKILERIVAGEVTLAFRRWRRSPPVPGATLKTALGVLVIDAVRPFTERDITAADAQRAGAPSRADLLASLRSEGDLLRIELHYQGADPRIDLREQRLDTASGESAQLLDKLRKIDARSPAPWTLATLELIERHPTVVARDLAKQLKMETLAFKRRVRQLKELGLTESLEVGYRLSPRGEDVLKMLRKPRSGVQ